MAKKAGTSIADLSTYEEPLRYAVAQILEYFLQGKIQGKEKMARYALLDDLDLDPIKVLKVCDPSLLLGRVSGFMKEMGITGKHFYTITGGRVAYYAEQYYMKQVIFWLNCLDFD